MRVKVLARVLRTVDKVGGLDEYLLGEKAGRVRELGMGGWALRWRVMRTEWYRLRRGEERRMLGLPVDGVGEGEGVESEREILGMGGVRGEEEAREREGAIDRVLGRVEREAEKGENGGVELGFMAEKEDGREKPRVGL